MRILAIHRYFWPDTPPYAVMLRAICAHWADADHEVEVLSSQPSYQPETVKAPAPAVELVDGFTVRRLPMRPDRGGFARRTRNMLRFTLLVTWRVLTGPPRDAVMCSTAPQVLLGWATSLAARRRGSVFIYHCMDLHPEIGALSGEFAHPLVYRLLLRLDTAACRRAAAVVVLSNDMCEALLRRDRALADRIVVLNNFDLPQYGNTEPGEAPIERSDDLLTVAFAGNVGRFQGLETLVEAVLTDDTSLARVRLVIMGDGSAKAVLATAIAAAPPERRPRVVLLPHGAIERARALMRVADWGLVSLAPGVIEFAYPSKTATYLSEGLPVLAAVERDSALVRDIESWGVGRHLPLDSPNVVRRTLAELVHDRAELPQLREAARDTWSREFDMAGRLRRWDELLEQVTGGV